MLSRCKSLLVLLILATAGTWGLAQGQDQETSRLSLADFKELKVKLDIKNQPWASIPWKYSLAEARQLAAKTKKPIFMVVNTGNVMGCV
jgi:hypothetical protein